MKRLVVQRAIDQMLQINIQTVNPLLKAPGRGQFANEQPSYPADNHANDEHISCSL